MLEEGNQVKPGDPLVVIKPDIYKSSLSRAEAALNSSHARLAQAQAQLIEKELAYKRADQLFKSQTIPVSDFETADAGYKVAEAEVKAAEFTVKSAEASVSEASEQLTKTRIFAPIPGTVSRLNVEKGERVVGTNMYAGTEMMVIADLDKMEVQVDVNENDIVKVSLGDTALVEVDAYMNRKFKGIVTEIANSARTTGTTTDQVTKFRGENIPSAGVLCRSDRFCKISSLSIPSRNVSNGRYTDDDPAKCNLCPRSGCHHPAEKRYNPEICSGCRPGGCHG